VITAEVDKFQACCRESHELLRIEMEGVKSTDNWGLLRILEIRAAEETTENSTAAVVDNEPNHGVLHSTENGVTVKNIFSAETNGQNVEAVSENIKKQEEIVGKFDEMGRSVQT